MLKLPVVGQIDQRILTVLGAFFVQFMTIGLLFAYGLFFKNFEVEYGWSRTLLSSSMSIAFFLSGVLAFFGGYLSDRFGPRLVLIVSGLLGCTGYVLLSQITEPWHLVVVFGLFIGVGLATHDVVTLSTIAKLFEKRRGIMTAVVKVGTATGQMVVPLVAAFLIALYDWRLALIILGIGGAVVLVVAAFLMKNPAAKNTNGVQADVPGTSFADARKSPVFWMICAIQFCFFITLATIPLHIVIHGMDLGMTPAVAASLLSVMGGASIIGRLSVGGLIDRIGGKRALIFCFLPLIASLLAFYAISVPWMLFVGVAVYGVGHGGFFTVTSPTIAQYFGLKAHGKLFGLVLFFGMFGGGLGPILGGRVFDMTGSYGPAFLTLASLAAVGLILSLRLPSKHSA
ncbi:MAG: MFS transporter [Alphaproteobacteria bacterium]|nr:MFS transporter [Alphaproteobacteria bacterium]MBT4086336.1 MFS transporter [Alphaproteobacteria bacterium]MBT4546316.1 MFS transporter [Alphaproteobacteria bacterium]MBT7744149.1 MFS transporter [Alphaproteobacteria bacterium]